MSKKRFKKLIKLFAILALVLPLFSGFGAIRTSGETSGVINPNYQEQDSDIGGSGRPLAANTWKVAGHERVLNHTGNTVRGINNFITDAPEASESDFPDIGSSNTLDNTWIQYGTMSQPEFDITQFAKETKTPGLYDVFTHVKGYRHVLTKPLDVILVSDFSASMDSQSRMNYWRGAVNEFSNLLTNYEGVRADDVRVGHVAFGSKVYNTGNDANTATYFSLKNYGQAAEDLKRIANPQQTPISLSSNYTFTQAGLRAAQNMFDVNDGSRERIVILLTDGIPTFSNSITGFDNKNSNNTIDIGEVTETTGEGNSPIRDGVPAAQTPSGANTTVAGNGNGYNGSARIIDWSQGVNGGLRPRNAVGSSSSNPQYDNVFPATIFQADKMQQDGIQLYGIGMNIAATNTSGTERGFNIEEVKKNFERLVDGENYDYESSESKFTNFPGGDFHLISQKLSGILQDHLNTVNNGQINIKIGEQFNLESSSVKANLVGTGGNIGAIDSSANDSIVLSDISLGANQEVQIYHQVRIKTEDTNFVPEQWYHISDPVATQFVNNTGSVNSRTEALFAVPSGNAPGVDLDFAKHWVANLESIPKQLELVLGRSTENGISDWEKSVLLSSEGDWKASLSKLPKFSNLGLDFNYKVNNEIFSDEDKNLSKVYQWDVTGTTDMTVVNTERFRLQLIKTSNHTNKPLAGVEFILKNSEGKEVARDRTGESGEIIFEDFRLNYGEEYSLSETTPAGHKPTEPWTIKAEIKEGKPVVFVEGEKVELDAENNRFVLTLNITNEINVEAFKNSVKVDKRDAVTGQSISGAHFNLYHLNALSDDLADLTALESFDNLLPGLYALQEVAAPNGYFRNDEVQYFRIDFEGGFTAINAEGEEIPFLEEAEIGQNGFIFEKDEENNPRLTLIFHNRAAPPLYLDVTKRDADFTSPLAGVTFELTKVGRINGEDGNAGEATSPLRLFRLFDSVALDSTVLLKSNDSGRLSPLDDDGNLIENADPIELDYDTEYQLFKKDAVGLFPNFGELSQWTIKTPTAAKVQEHANVNSAITISGDDLIETPDEAISGSVVHPPSPVGYVSLITTQNADFKPIVNLESSTRAALKMARDNEVSAYVISFEVHSNITHPFTIEKVDARNNTPMDTQFILRWVQRFVPTTDFDSLKTLNLEDLELSGGEDEDSDAVVDVSTGATLSTVNGSKTLNHMSRGNLYIISEDTPPAGYQPTNTVIVAYMDEAQGYSDVADIHIRLARRSANNPNLLEFGALEEFPEYRGTLDDKIGLVFANFELGEPNNGNGDNGGNDEDVKDEGSSKLPSLGVVSAGIAGIGTLVLIAAYLMKKYLKK
ncbi:vWA domain-containing protein [Lactococcus protaetiae]|uniref:VWA domain-containing protein n=1 Tax=Lactococcus protaetiae TaxID=2592653 RepID=A0A514Z991_9LACT|nr:vWA domain-containing protein [Lactococcus protaetiae]QDK71156.1 VWA domain-containing protein [Lactococcus protaetiae]